MSFIQVASWNIEHLSGASREEKRQSVYALADHIEMAGVDLIALQEVYVTPSDEEVRLFENQPIIESHATSERRNSDLDQVCYLLEEHIEDRWEYLILPNRQNGDKSQLCAVMWNTTRMEPSNLLRLEVAHEVDGDALWDRTPHVVEFKSNVKVWRKDSGGEWTQVEENKVLSIVPLHMKSNWGGATVNRRKRGKEAKELVKALEAVKDQIDPSLILIGDTNVLKYDEPAIETLVNAGYIDLNNTDGSTYWSRDYGDSPFDRAFVASDREEFKYSRQYVLRSSDLVLHDRFLSDHYMIKLSVKIYLDDADPRDGL